MTPTRVNAVYVSPSQQYFGRRVSHACLLITDMVDLAELHRVARTAGIPRSWFREHILALPHYELTKRYRKAAVKRGAIQVDQVGFLDVVRRWRDRAKLAGAVL